MKSPRKTRSFAPMNEPEAIQLVLFSFVRRNIKAHPDL
jgi:hypothetical protein